MIATNKRSAVGHSFRAAQLSAALLCALFALAAATLGATFGAAVASAATSPGGTASPGAAAPPVATAPAKRAPAVKKPAANKQPAKTQATSSLHVTSVRITSVKCVPEAKCSGNPHQVSVHGTLLIAGKGIAAGSSIGFPAKPGGRIVSNSPIAHVRKTIAGLILTVPAKAHSGHVMVLLSGSRHSSSYGPIYVYNHALHPPKPVATPAPAAVGAVSGSPFESQGMWIWYVSKSSGGSVPAIVAQAHAANVSTVFVKSSDGSSNYWSQFSPQLVAEMHANGLKICAWQYVYGTNPEGEANLGAEAVANGADCLVIDAEAEYEGHYAAAQTYIDDLRAKIGTAYPLGLASFPYVSYHPSFPYSVFLGPNGAQYNAPQMYWKDIGTSVDTVYANTYIANRIYGRPIYPLGQTYGGISATELLRFREEAVDYGATGLSFWDWQETPTTGWSTLAAPLAPLTSVVPNSSYPELHSGAKGDQVLWLQEHLAAAVPSQEITGLFGSETTANLESFQSEHGLTVTGVAEPTTWAALLALTPAPVDWTGGGPSSG